MILYNLRHWPTTTIIEGLYKIQRKRFVKAKKKQFIVIACFPRSASNYFAQLISDATGYKRNALNPMHGFFHDVIYLPKLIDQIHTKTLIDQHLRATSLTRSLFSELKIQPIVLVRNIYDVVISYNDYITKKGYSPLDPDREELTPEFCANYHNFDDSRKYDYLIDMVVPWYITFYVSWFHYTRKTKLIDACWIEYKDLVTNPKKTLLKIVDFYNLSVPIRRIDSILEKKNKVNYNVGISGRGDILSDIQKEKIKNLASYHSDIDFSMIGL